MSTSIAFTVYPVSDLQRAVDFYRAILDLDEPARPSDYWAEFTVGESIFAVATGGEQIGLSPGSAFSIAFEVPDLQGVRERIVAQGVEADEAFDTPTCNSFFAKDPDGNRFTVHKLKR